MNEGRTERRLVVGRERREGRRSSGGRAIARPERAGLAAGSARRSSGSSSPPCGSSAARPAQIAAPQLGLVDALVVAGQLGQLGGEAGGAPP